MVHWPSNNIYKAWKAYGGTDSIIAEIQESIEKKKGSFKFTREESKKTREN